MSGLIVNNFLFIGCQYYPPSSLRSGVLPVTTDGCVGNHSNYKPVEAQWYQYQDQIPHALEDVFALSYVWQGTIGCWATIVVGILLSYIISRSNNKLYSAK